MKTYITKLNGMSPKSVVQYKQTVVADIAHQLGFREMGIYYYDANGESLESRTARFDGIIAGISAGDIVVCQFPTWNGLRFERALVEHIKAYRGRVIIFIHDVEALMIETSRFMLRETVELYNQAEVLIVPSVALKVFLLEQGIRTDMKFVIQELWDADTDVKIEKESWLYSTSGNQFGVVWYQDQYAYQYMQYSASFLLSQYLAAEIPVIVPRGISCEKIIEDNHLGVIVDSLEEAEEQLKKIGEEYQEYVHAVKEFVPSIQNGYYTKCCLMDAVQKLYRKTTKINEISSQIYHLNQQGFTVAKVKESFRKTIALSWEYKGHCDGFLIYDESKNLIYETDSPFQHYLHLEKYEKDCIFEIKSYVNTMKGKLVIAEVTAEWEQSERCKNPKISLIMPVYNAEEYIARSIDTVLAQSMTEMEVVLIDDGSTDKTSEIIDWYASHYANIVPIHKMNGGVAAARNTGIEHASGEYIAFMDNDDMIRPEMMKQLYDSIIKNVCDIAISPVYQITKDGYDVFLQYHIPEDTAIETNVFFEMYIEKGYAIPAIWNKLYKASIVKEHLFPTFMYDDEAWTPYVMSYADQICYIDTFGYEYDRQIRSETQIDEWVKQKPEEIYEAHKKVITFYLENGNPNKLNLLKKLAIKELEAFGKNLKYDKYKELRDQIEHMEF